MAEIKVEKINIGTLFGEGFQFKIPNFQRPLSWKEDNFEKLFEYIYDSFTNKQDEYFLGSIILQKEDEFFLIIDGQQRLMSLAILLAVIRDKIKNGQIKREIQRCLFQEEIKIKNLPAIARIKMWEDLTSLEDYIYKENKTLEYNKIKFKDKEDPKYSLYLALDTFFSEYEEKLKDDEEAEKFVNYLLTKVYIICIYTESLPYAIKLFNVLNTTGLPLTTADILKAVNLSEIEEKEREKYSKKWREIENNLGREEVEKIIEFIRTMKLKTKAKKGIYEEYEELIFNKFLKKGKELIEYFEKISNIYRDIVLEPWDLKIDSKYKHLVELMKDHIPFDDWIPPLLAFYEKFENFKKDKKSINNFLYEFLINLEKKTVVEWVNGFTFTKRIESLNKIIKIIEEETEPEEVIKKMKLDEEELKKKFQMQIESSDFYNEKFAKYLLLRLDLEKWDLENFGGYQGIITVEHILPRNPLPESEWCELFNEAERKEWTNKIGNLVLLGKRKNSRAQNYEFKNKKEIYFFKGGSTPFKITEELKEIEEWNLEMLKQRQDKMVNTLLELYFGK
ncbi:MAG: DUF262 domain-containing HNH endonuclease family protein [candidate division WOR-3 bacterium]